MKTSAVTVSIVSCKVFVFLLPHPFKLQLRLYILVIEGNLEFDMDPGANIHLQVSVDKRWHHNGSQDATDTTVFKYKD